MWLRNFLDKYNIDKHLCEPYYEYIRENKQELHFCKYVLSKDKLDWNDYDNIIKLANEEV